MAEARDLLAEPEDLAITPGFVSLTRNSVVFAMGAIAGKAVGLVMLPVLTRMLGPAEYGSMDVLMSLGTATTATLLLGLDVAALRLYFDQPDDVSRRRLLSTWLAIGLGASSVAAIVIAWQAAALSNVLFHQAGLALGVAAIAVIVVAQTAQVIALTVLRAEGRAWVYALLSGGVLVLYAAIAVALLVAWRADANAVLIAWAVALVVSGACGLLLVRRRLASRPSSELALRLLRLGLPLAPGVTASLVADFANRAILLGSDGATHVGFFTVAVRFASIAGLAVTGFQLAWQPRAFSLGTGAGAWVRIGADGRRVIAVVAVLVGGLAAIAPELLRLVAGEAYADALPAVGLSLVGTLGSAIFLVASLPSVMTRDTKDVGVAMGLGVGCGVLLNLVLAPRLGSTGTAAAVAMGQLTAALLAATFSWRRANIGLGSAQNVLLIAGSIGTALLVTTLMADAPLAVRVAPAVVLAALAVALEARQSRVAGIAGWPRP